MRKIFQFLAFIILCFSCSEMQAQYFWRTKACFPTSRAGGATFGIGSKAFYVGGSNTSGTIFSEVYQYDETTNTWTQKNNFPGVRAAPSSFVINDTAYVGLGIDAGGVYHNEFYRYDQTNDAWVQVASFPGAARYTAMSFVVNGKGYIGCGKGGGQNNDFYEYDPALNKWTQKANFPGAARQNGIGAGVGNYGYMGLGYNGSYFTDFYRYDPVTNTWTTLSSFPGLGRFSANHFVIQGSIYVAGGALSTGVYGTDTWKYDTATGAWTSQASFGCVSPPVDNWEGFAINGHGYMATSQQASSNGKTNFNEHLLEFTQDDFTFIDLKSVLGSDTTYCGSFSRVLSTGNSCSQWSTGVTGSQITVTTPGIYWEITADSCGMVSDTIHIFQNPGITSSLGNDTALALGQTLLLNPNSSGAVSYQWQDGSTNPTYTVTTAGTYGVTVTNASGCQSSSSTKVAYPTAYTWRTKACMPDTARNAHATFSVGGKGYIVCGLLSNFKVTSQVWMYDPVTNMWTEKNRFPAGQRAGQCSFVINDTAYVGLGSPDNNGTYVTEFYRYNAGNDTWTAIASFPGAARYFAMAFALNGKGYVGCGKGASQNNDFYQYNPATNTWAKMANFPGTGRQNGMGIAVGGLGYMGLGYNGVSLTDFYSYNSNTNTWTQLAKFAGTGCAGPGYFAINDTLYVAGGAVPFDNDCWRYDVNANVWVREQNFGCVGDARSGCFGFGLNGKGFIFGGDDAQTIFYNQLLQFGPDDISFTQRVHLLGNDTSYCGNFSRVLSSGNSCSIWSTGVTGSQITVTIPGTYWVRVPDTCGMVSDTINISAGSVGSVMLRASGPTDICQGSIVTLDAGAYDSYLWSDNETTRTIDVMQAGNYSCTVTSGGCSAASDTIAVTVSANPSPTIIASGSTTFCQGDSITLDAGAGYDSYLWSDNETTETITVKQSGNYSCTVAQGSCSGTSNTVTVTVNNNPTPTIAANGPTTFCQGGSVKLDAGAGYDSYLWSDNETTETITVKQTGNYSCTVTQGSCSGTSNTVTVTVNNNPAPTITANGATTFCQGGSVKLDAGAGYDSYLWSDNETTETITVKQSGNYSCTVTQGSCSGTSNTVTVTVNNNPTPTIAANDPTTFCQGGSVTLDAGAGYSSYLWSDNETTEKITVSQNGSYSCTVTQGSCSGTSNTVTVTVNNNPAPTITANGPTTFCQGGSVKLDAGAGYDSYLWSDNETTETITVKQTGNYSCTVTQGSCSGTSNTVTVTVNNNPASTITANGATTFCQGGSVKLDAGAGYSSYLWSDNETTETITVKQTGNYSCTVTQGSCSGTSNTVTVTVNNNPAPTITANGPTTFCQGGSVTLDAGAGYSSYLWSDNETTETITVKQTGNYSCTVTQGSCSGTSNTVTVSVNNTPPNAVCKSATVTLVNGNASITASNVDGGSTATCGIASEAVSPSAFTIADTGVKTVVLTVTDLSGNSSTCNAQVTVLNSGSCTPFSCSIVSQPTSSCKETGGNPDVIYLGYGPQSTRLVVSVTGNGPYTYSWSPSAYLSSSSSSSPVFTPTAPGLYTFTVTVSQGANCSSTCSITICVLDIRVHNKSNGCGGWNDDDNYGYGRNDNNNKVYLCHYPPGCHSNPQTISVSVNAVSAHISCHPGDHLGTCNQSCSSNERAAEVPELAATDETGNGFELLVYPNPYVGEFNLRINTLSTSPIDVTLYDITGQIVSHQTNVEANNSILMGGNLAKGLYFVEVIQDGSRKVIKVNKAE